MNARQQFQQVLAPTSFEPIGLHIVKAKGSTLYDADGKTYIDLIGGISVANTGHSEPYVVKAVADQAEKYMHIMVYGELVQTPQTAYATLLTEHLDQTLHSVYFTNSGAEAVEGAMKLAKRYTQRTEIIAFGNSYHGSTQGALSIMGDEFWRNAYRPLLPDIRHLRYNNFDDLEQISCRTAAVFAELVQAEAGVNVPRLLWLHALRKRCTETGTLLIIDEIQTGFGRTGRLFAHQLFDILPDILLLGKALGGGMPLGAFIAPKKIMNTLAENPVLGHLTTFGGHPVSCAAGKAALEFMLQNQLMDTVESKSLLFREKLQHPLIRKITCCGLIMAVHLESFNIVQQVIKHCITADHAVFTDWFLFAPHCIRIVPPLVISDEEIVAACTTIVSVLDKIRP